MAVSKNRGSVAPEMADPMDRALIERVAELSSLSLTEAEAETLTREVAAILAYMGELATLDTSNVPPTAQVGTEHPAALRADEVVPGLSQEDALAQAPRTSQGGFAVPGFVESDS
jgi:aspartyl-tRNA(Asn)/glutamyl-tRNA(Gln) amidotransferase subunit C